MRVSAIMTTKVITVKPDTKVQEVARLLAENRIRSVPVIDDTNRVVGVITASDLFLKEKGIPFSAIKLPVMFKKWADPARLVEIIEEARYHSAKDVMTEEVVTVSPDETIGHAALLMARHDLSAIPVVQEGKLAGLISRTDLIRLIADSE